MTQGLARASILAAVLAACTGGTTATDTGGTDTGDPITEFGTCPSIDEVEAAEEASHDVLFEMFGTLDSVSGEWDWDPAMVITDEQAYADLEARLDTDLAEVDFTTRQVLVATIGVSSTCGLELDRFRVASFEAAVHLDLIVEDTSGACEDACDHSAGQIVAVAVSNEHAGTVCARRVDTCDE